MDHVRDILDREIEYVGERISLGGLQSTITDERQRQNAQLRELSRLRERNADLQDALHDEMSRLREISQSMSRERERGSFKSWFSWLPWIRSDSPSRRSIEDLLRRQYEMSAMRLKEAAEFADRLEAAKSDLYDEIERLNRKIVDSAKNEEVAGDYVMDLRTAKETLEREIGRAEPSSARERELQSDLDRCRRLLAEHSTRLKLYDSAEERLAKLRRNTRTLADTISNLQADITRYVTAASEKMDLVAGQIQAIGAAADASMVMLELKQSLDAMTESVNHTTRFVAETQQYFRANVDQMIDDLELYDEETAQVLEENQARNEILDEIEMERSMSSALARKIDALADEVEFEHGEEEEQVVLATQTEQAK
jgi:hypothetical protein